MKMSVTAVLACAAVGVLCQSARRVWAGPPSGQYELLVEDNFDGTRVDETFWDYRLGKRGGDDPAAGWINALNLKENVTVGGGMMRIRHAQEQINGKTENTCGGLISKTRFGFGYYECRYMPLMLTTPGTHAAFWQRGINRGREAGQDLTRPVQDCVFEIDSSEITSPNWVGTNNLYPQIATRSAGIPWVHRCSIPIEHDVEGYVVDAYEYRPDGIIFYDNGKAVARTSWNMTQAQQEVWLTSLCGAHFRDMDAKQLPGEALFDYFRFYVREWPGVNLLGNGGFEYNTDRIDPQSPVCWMETGDIEASVVVSGDGIGGGGCLRQGSKAAYKVTTSQTLQHIPDGTYMASAMVRSSGGQAVARFRVFDCGGAEQAVDVQASAEWKRVEIGHIEVKDHTATVGVSSEGDGGQWLEVDDVTFMSPPRPGEKAFEPMAFKIPQEPVFELFTGTMQSFADGRNYLFDRWVGSGKAMTVAMKVRAARLADQVPIEKFPSKGEAGWSIHLTDRGDVVFEIGSASSHTSVRVAGVYEVGKVSNLAFTFESGVASIYVDGKLAASQSGVPHVVDEKATPGAIGKYWSRKGQAPSYDGEIGDLVIDNRAMSAEELAKLALR